MEFKERVKAFCRYKGIPVSAFEKECGLSNGYLGNLKNGINITKLDNILKRFPEINKDWFVYGNGEMLVKNNDEHDKVSGQAPNYNKPETNIEGSSSMIEIIKSQQNTIERLTKIIDNMIQSK